MGALYLVTSPSGKQYIGVTVRPLAVRMARHWADAAKGSDCALHRAARKYGVESMQARVLVEADCPKYLRLLERKAIRSFNTKAPNGYNLTDGGDGLPGMRHTAAARERMSVSQAESWQDESIRRKRADGISAARKRNWVDPAYRAAMAKAKQSESHKSVMAAHLSGLWSERRAVMLDGIAARWSDLKQRKQHSDIARSTWADPEVRARRIAAMKEAYAKRRAAAKA